MAYQKKLIDNPACSRRFHVTFDDEADPLPRVQVPCPFCGETVFAAENHPKVKLAREENLVKTSHLSENLMPTCSFVDNFPQKSAASSEEPSTSET